MRVDNDKLIFPMQLDMFKYTEDGISYYARKKQQKLKKRNVLVDDNRGGDVDSSSSFSSTVYRENYEYILRGVVAQQLLPSTSKGKRVAAREILINTPAVANLVRENNISQIQSAIQTGAKQGMISMENSIKQLLKEELIDKETAEKRIGRARKI